MAKRGFGELELAVLNILKSHGRVTVKQIHTLLGTENKYTTVMTVMARLANKKVLGRERVGLHYEYWLLQPNSSVSLFLNYFKKKFFGLKTADVVSYLIESDDITAEELEAMENMIRDVKKRKTNEC